ncbi:hypothetical protein [Amycolatopsis sp. NBC_01480]|uniref:hypothetical protein n=1 Tax=Amycolatopsis sp. NBC_01480 TaxID=2903562 RepID=UPI002E2A9F2D|nr:hypothetical protein [Amycolatopsis sp. NBC_01480]
MEGRDRDRFSPLRGELVPATGRRPWWIDDRWTGRASGLVPRVGGERGAVVAGVLSLLVLCLTGYGWTQYNNLVAGLHTSDALGGDTKSANGDTNILIMGLDSRLDENGNALPRDIYDALHAGDQQGLLSTWLAREVVNGLRDIVVRRTRERSLRRRHRPRRRRRTPACTTCATTRPQAGH